MKTNLKSGQILQVLDFAMNYNNRYQDEIQSAYYDGSQTTIHAVINFFLCLRESCSEVVTLAVVQISDDMKHDSFLSCTAQNANFKYLATLGIALDMIIQFCDNCSAQFKSRRPFAELARLSLNVIRVFYGKKHGKSHADSLFGRLKAWMSHRIRTRKAAIRNARDFFNHCKEHYETLPTDSCHTIELYSNI